MRRPATATPYAETDQPSERVAGESGGIGVPVSQGPVFTDPIEAVATGTGSIRPASPKSPGSGVRRPAVGAIVACAILLAAGFGYRVVAGWYDRDGDRITLSPGALAAFPMHISDWTGHDVPLDRSIIEKTDTDDHLSRAYQRAGGREAVSMFVGFGVAMRDLLPHRPEVCYVGAGWALEQTRDIQTTGSEGTVVPCRMYTFKRGGLDSRTLTVLSYYLVNDQYSADVSLLRSNAWRPPQTAGYVVQVQIAGSGADRLQYAEESVRRFAADTALPLRDLVVRRVREARGLN
ncbi:MAG: exosortase-associated EpsI family protein [Phycisphaerae bacterium]